MALISNERKKTRVMINKRTLNKVVIKRKDRHMKKSLIAIAVVIIVGTSGLAIAQMNDKSKEMMGDKAGMMDGKNGMMGMMGKGMMDGKMMGMCPMMKSTMERSVVATSDGGVIVVMGNKLTKYDKDLNVTKEVELKMDMEGMQKMMENMKGMCPMMGKGMMGNMDNDTGAKTGSSAPAKEVDHASHH